MQKTAELLPGGSGTNITALLHSWQCLSNQNKILFFFFSSFADLEKIYYVPSLDQTQIEDDSVQTSDREADSVFPY